MKQNVAKMLSAYFSKVMREKTLSSYDVSRASRVGGAEGIDQSYVNKLKNASITTVPSSEKLQALAKGLGVPEDDLFNIVRGLGLDREAISHNILKAMDFAYGKMPKAKKQKADYLFELLDREIQRILTEE